LGCFCSLVLTVVTSSMAFTRSSQTSSLTVSLLTYCLSAVAFFF
jgi:hypothetical protein